MNSPSQKHPYFLWDYDLTEADIRRILHGDNETERIWMTSRILESARFEDVWTYISLSELRKIFSKLRLKPPIRRAWELALRVWKEDQYDQP